MGIFFPNESGCPLHKMLVAGLNLPHRVLPPLLSLYILHSPLTDCLTATLTNWLVVVTLVHLVRVMMWQKKGGLQEGGKGVFSPNSKLVTIKSERATTKRSLCTDNLSEQMFRTEIIDIEKLNSDFYGASLKHCEKKFAPRAGRLLEQVDDLTYRTVWTVGA